MSTAKRKAHVNHLKVMYTMVQSESYIPYPGSDEFDDDTGKTVRELLDEEEMDEIAHEKKTKRRTLRRRYMTGAAIVLTATGGLMQKDILQQKSELQGTEPGITMMYENHNPEYEHNLTVVASGLGTRDADKMANVLTAHQKIGSVASLEYSNKNVDIDELVQQVIDFTQKKDINTINFDGYSAGGPITLAMAAEIHVKYPKLIINSLTFNSSPFGPDGISKKSENSAKNLSRFISIDPDLIYSSYARLFVEVYSRRDLYFDKGTFGFDFNRFQELTRYEYDTKVANKNAASGLLIEAQYDFLQDAGAQRNLKALAQPNNGQDIYIPPQIYYTRADDPRRDTTVNDMQSQNSLQQMTDENGLNLTVVPVVKARHADLRDHPKEYNKAIINDIQPGIIVTMKLNEIVTTPTPTLAASGPDDDVIQLSPKNNAIGPAQTSAPAPSPVAPSK